MQYKAKHAMPLPGMLSKVMGQKLAVFLALLLPLK
jgi:hypothetical protein